MSGILQVLFRQRLLLLLFCLCLLAIQSFAQTETDEAMQGSYLKVQWENDFLNLGKWTDRYYTNGIRINYIPVQWSRRKPLAGLANHIMISFPPTKQERTYGLFIGQNMYTPVNTNISPVQFGDRPYGGWLYIGLSSQALLKNYAGDSGRNGQKLTSELYLGVMGSPSLAAETQTFIHNLFGYNEPKGWGNQINTSVGINYLVRYERLVGITNKAMGALPYRRAELIAVGEVQTGTVFDKVGLGLNLRLGKMAPYFSSLVNAQPSVEKRLMKASPLLTTSQVKRRNWEYYLFFRPVLRFVLYNAFLQGNLLGKNSVYALSGNEIRRVYLNMEYGLCVRYRGISLIASQGLRTPEFEGAATQRWGSFGLLLYLK